jgi:hypothetical protein
MERIRINREDRDREANRHVPKASPWHDPQPEMALKKVALQTGAVTPGQVGLELEPKPKGEKPALEMKTVGPPGGKKTGQPQQGRPKNSGDKQKRKTKKFTPKLKALELWANEAQDEINKLVSPALLQYFNKKNMRSLTEGQHKQAELIKFGLLCHMTPFGIIDGRCVAVIASKRNGGIPKDIRVHYNVMLEEATNQFQRKLTLEELRNIQASSYALVIGERNGYY